MLREVMYPQPFEEELNRAPVYKEKNLASFILKHDTNKRYCFISFLLFMEHFGVVCKQNPLQHIQLILERQQIIEKSFRLQLRDERQFFRIPKHLSQEILPLSFGYYNYLHRFITQTQKDVKHEILRKKSVRARTCNVFSIIRQKIAQKTREMQAQDKHQHFSSRTHQFLIKDE